MGFFDLFTTEEFGRGVSSAGRAIGTGLQEAPGRELELERRRLGNKAARDEAKRRLEEEEGRQLEKAEAAKLQQLLGKGVRTGTREKFATPRVEQQRLVGGPLAEPVVERDIPTRQEEVFRPATERELVGTAVGAGKAGERFTRLREETGRAARGKRRAELKEEDQRLKKDFNNFRKKATGMRLLIAAADKKSKAGERAARRGVLSAAKKSLEIKNLISSLKTSGDIRRRRNDLEERIPVEGQGFISAILNRQFEDINTDLGDDFDTFEAGIVKDLIRIAGTTDPAAAFSFFESEANKQVKDDAERENLVEQVKQLFFGGRPTPGAAAPPAGAGPAQDRTPPRAGPPAARRTAPPARKRAPTQAEKAAIQFLQDSPNDPLAPQVRAKLVEAGVL